MIDLIAITMVSTFMALHACWIFSLLLLRLHSTATAGCFCGFGGICRFKNDKPLPCNCTDCRRLSKGLYDNCSKLVNHCSVNPCLNGGKCTPSFGGFFCNCSKGFVGHRCQALKRQHEGDPAVGPRVWFQVNRVHPAVYQVVRFTVESLGYRFSLFVSFSDRRRIIFDQKDLKRVNARQECVQDVRDNPQERDMGICKTLPKNKDVLSVKILTNFTNTFYGQGVLVRVGKKIEGRVDKIGFTVMNGRRITYSRTYRVHTSFDWNAACVYSIKFRGCSRRFDEPVLHELDDNITLTAIERPIRCAAETETGCSCIVRSRKWKPPTGSEWRLMVGKDHKQVTVIGSTLRKSGVSYIDYSVVVQGNPAYLNVQHMTHNYARCWFKTVLGKMAVDFTKGTKQNMQCGTSVNHEILNGNPNYSARHLITIWRCNLENQPFCAKQRFKGTKAYLGSLPCGVYIKFWAMVIHSISGNKVIITKDVRTYIQQDEMFIRCDSGCYPAVDPRAPIALSLKRKILTTGSLSPPVIWSAEFAGENFKIEKYLLPGSRNLSLLISNFTFFHLKAYQQRNPNLIVRATSGHMNCEIRIRVRIDSPLPVIRIRKYMAKKLFPTDPSLRYSVIIDKHSYLAREEPVFYVVEEEISPYEQEAVMYVDALRRGFFGMQLEYEARLYTVDTKTEMYSRGDKYLIISNNTLVPPVLSRDELIKLTEGLEEIALSEDNEVIFARVRYLSRRLASTDFLVDDLRCRVLEVFLQVRYSSHECQLQSGMLIINRLYIPSKWVEPPYNSRIFPWRVSRFPYDFTGEELLTRLKLKILLLQNLKRGLAVFYVQTKNRGFSTSLRNSQGWTYIYEAMLKVDLVELNTKDYLEQLDMDQRFKAVSQLASIKDWMEKCIVDLMLSTRIFARTVGNKFEHSIGSSTFLVSLSIKPEESNWISLNNIQNVSVMIRPSKSLQPYNGYRSDLFNLAIFLPVPRPEDYSSRMYILVSSVGKDEEIPVTVDSWLKVYHRPSDISIDVLPVFKQRSYIGKSEANSIYVYRITVDPTERSNYIAHNRTFQLHVNSHRSLKMTVKNNIPDLDDVHTGRSVYNNILHGNETFLALLPSQDEFQHGNRQLRIRLNNQHICIVRNLFWKSRPVRPCEDLHTSAPEHHGEYVSCRCFGDGEIFADPMNIRVARILPDRKTPPQHSERQYLWNLIPIVILCLLVILTYLYAHSMDKFFSRQRFAVPLEDEYVSSTAAYAIGIHLGTQCFGGTSSHVALKMFGSDRNSRVHILSSKKHGLRCGLEKWFIMYCKQTLGKIMQIKLWHDFSGCSPDWYLTKLTVHDLEHNQWYKFSVNRWFRLEDDDERCKFLLADALQWYPEKEALQTFSLCNHIIMEIRNKHVLFSPLTKHSRFVLSYRKAWSLSWVYIMSLLLMSAVVVKFLSEQPPNLLNFEFAIVIGFLSIVPHHIVQFTFLLSTLKMRKTRLLDFHLIFKEKRHTHSRRGSSHSLFQTPNEHLETEDSPSKEPSRPAGSRSDASEASSRRKTLYKGSGSTAFSEENSEPSTSFKNIWRKRGKTKYGLSPPLYYSIVSALKSPKERYYTDDSALYVYPGRMNWIVKWFHQWVASSTFRPICLSETDNELVTRESHKSIRIIKWSTGIIIALASLAGFIAITIAFTGEEIKSWTMLTVLAILFSSLVVSPLEIFLISASMAIFTGRTNHEEHCLDISSHSKQRFVKNQNEWFINYLETATKPFYQPITSEKLRDLRKKNDKKKLLHSAVHIVILFIIFSPILLMSILDSSGNLASFRWQNSIKNFFSEPAKDSVYKKTLKQLYNSSEIEHFLVFSLLPKAHVTKWYNGKPIHEERIPKQARRREVRPDNGSPSQENQYFPWREGWLEDRSSRLCFLPRIRLLEATERQPVLKKVPIILGLGQYDEEANRSVVNDDTHTISTQFSQGLRDRLFFYGVIGVTKKTYCFSVGRIIYLKSDQLSQMREVANVFRRNVTERTRAILVEFIVIMPPPSKSIGIRMAYVTVLFENLAAGPYSGTIRVSAYSSKPQSLLITALKTTAILAWCSLMVISLWSVSRRRQRRLSNYVALGVFACIIASSKLAIALIEETDPLPANLAKDEYFDRSFFESKVTEFHQVFLGIGGLCCGLLLLFLIKVSVFNMEFGIRVRTIIYMILSILIFYAIRLTPKSGHPSEVEALDFLLNHNDPEPSLFEEWILFGGAFATLFWQKILSVIVLCWFYNSLKKEKIAKIAIQVKHARRQSQIRTPLNVDDTNETVDVKKPPTDKKKSWFGLF